MTVMSIEMMIIRGIRLLGKMAERPQFFTPRLGHVTGFGQWDTNKLGLEA